MFRNLFSRGRRFSPDVAKIRVIPKWNVDRTLLFMVVGTMVLTDLPEQLTKSFGEPIFVPVGFARETQESVRGRRWQEDDPHYQTLVRLSRDPRRQKEVISRFLIDATIFCLLLISPSLYRCGICSYSRYAK